MKHDATSASDEAGRPAFSIKLTNDYLSNFGVAHKFKVVYIPTVDSTLNCAFDTEREGRETESGMVFVADQETAAAGFSGKWLSTQLDLGFTLIWQDPDDFAAYHMVSTIVGLAVISALKKITRDRIAPLYFKWPNDVFTADGAKICGALATSPCDRLRLNTLKQEQNLRLTENWMQIGVGVNLQSKNELVNPRYRATSVMDITGQSLRRELVLATVLSEFLAFLTLFQDQRTKLLDRLCDALYIGEGRHGQFFVSKDGSSDPDNRQKIEGTLSHVTDEGFWIMPDGDAETALIRFEDVMRIRP